MSPSEYSNKSQFGMETPKRYALASYYLFVLLSSLVGDTIILIASLKYRALKLHPFITAVIHHIAVSDLMVSVVYVLPKFIAMVADGWLLGDALCFFTAYGTYYFSLAGLLFICTLTSGKLIIVRRPLRSSALSRRKAHFCCAFLWVLSLTVPVIFLIVDSKDVWFDCRTSVCSYHFSSNRWELLKPIQFLTFMVIPNLIVISVTVLLLLHLIKSRKHSKKCGGTQRWQGMMTALLTAIMYCISILPYAIYRIAESNYPDRQGFFHTDFLRLSGVCLSLNTISNFYIYCLTVLSFREFLWCLLNGRSTVVVDHNVTHHVISTRIFRGKKEEHLWNNTFMCNSRCVIIIN